MTSLFFTTSAGDTDLAIDTIQSMAKSQPQQQLIFIPLSELALKRAEVLTTCSANVKIDKNFLHLERTLPDEEDLVAINTVIDKLNASHAFIGIPSIKSDNAALYLALKLNLHKVIALEYLYHEPALPLWSKIAELCDNNCHFAVPTSLAAKEITTLAPSAKVTEVGHLAIDKAVAKRKKPVSKKENLAIRTQLGCELNNDLKVISGTSVGGEIDYPFVQAILNELKKNNYPNLKVCFSIHPFVSNPDQYLAGLIEVCNRYPNLYQKFKIILPEGFVQKLTSPKSINLNNQFIIKAEISGQQATLVANGVAQAVPGALVNEAALLDNAAYCHEPVKSYLPSGLLSKDLRSFLSSPRKNNTDQQEEPKPNDVKRESCGTRIGKLMV